MVSVAYRRLIQWSFERLYREFAWTYDAVAAAVSGGLWRRWTLSAIPELRGRVLELGSGTGYVQLALADRPRVAGLDASPQMARLAARRVARAGHCPRVACGLAQALPFPAASFDSVLATFPAPYILDPRTHAEIRRVLAPGGRLVLVPLAQLDESPYTRMVDWLYRLTLQAPMRRHTPADPALATLQIPGLHLTPRWVPVGPSRALLLVGERSG